MFLTADDLGRLIFVIRFELAAALSSGSSPSDGFDLVRTGVAPLSAVIGPLFAYPWSN